LFGFVLETFQECEVLRAGGDLEDEEFIKMSCCVE
jgi:hypothetical protein